MRRPDFSAAHAVLRRHHDERRLSGASALIFQGSDVVDEFCIGEADIEQGQPMRPDHIHRAQSNTKLITAVMTLILADEGRITLDDPIKQWISAFGATRVLRPGATSLDDTEALARDITVRHPNSGCVMLIGSPPCLVIQPSRSGPPPIPNGSTMCTGLVGSR